MPEQPPVPAPRRSNVDAAFAERTKEIAKRNERVQAEARKARASRDQERRQRRRREDPD